MICNKLQLCVNEQFAGGKISGCVNHNFTKCVKSSDRRSKVKCEERKKNSVYGRIVVASSVPNIKASPDYVNLVRFIRKTFHGNIKIAERELLEKDFELNQG